MNSAKRWERNHFKILEKSFYRKQRGVMPKPTRVEQQKKGKGSYNRANWRKEGDKDRGKIAEVFFNWG